VAVNIKKKPSDVDNYVKILEENWIETVAAIKQLDDD
jgi:lipoate-protein ligase B